MFTFTEGTYGKTALKDLSCAVVITSAGKNMEKRLGQWRGVLYTPDTASAAEREALVGLVQAMFGTAFASLEQRADHIQITRRDDVHELVIGKVARLRIHALKGPDGKITTVQNAPSPLAYPTMSCALADVDTYDDGKTSWSLPGRNGFYADFDLSSPE